MRMQRLGLIRRIRLSLRPSQSIPAKASSSLNQNRVVKSMANVHLIHDTITLNEEEKELLGTLLEAAQHAGCGTVLRCAGGWVRDKLLGRKSLDIDVALDNMMGKDFADLVNQHLQSKASHHVASGKGPCHGDQHGTHAIPWIRGRSVGQLP